MKILYVCSAKPESCCEQRLEAMRRLGHEVGLVDTTAHPRPLPGPVQRLVDALDYHVFDWGLDPRRVNRRINQWLDQQGGCDVVWLDKALMVRPRTLERIRRRWPETRIVGYSPDDQLNPVNHSRLYLKSLPLYDLCFTTKSYNVPELEELGARKAVCVGNAFDPLVHRPVEVTDQDRRTYGADVAFVGTYADPRAASLERVAELSCDLKVWGNGWEELSPDSPLREAVQGTAVYGDEYARVICASAVNLNFLRKANRDLVTIRSVEIPACGGFMLAERTDEHLALFEEGVEAEYFGDDREMIRKIRHYLDHPDEREAIARRARERCLRDGYSNDDRLADMLSQVEEMAPQKTEPRSGP